MVGARPGPRTRTGNKAGLVRCSQFGDGASEDAPFPGLRTVHTLNEPIFTGFPYRNVGFLGVRFSLESSRKDTATREARITGRLCGWRARRQAESRCWEGVTGGGWRFGFFALAASRCASHGSPGRLRRVAPV